jgi:hypothetical protein
MEWIGPLVRGSKETAVKKLAVLATTLILGASSVALADHATPNASYAPSDRAYRPRPLPVPSWTTLSLGRLSMRGRALVDVSSNERFEKLKLEAFGAMFVDRIKIVFANGKSQVIDVDRRLGRGGESSLTFDLEKRSRKIDKIVVYGRGGQRASFKLMAI